MRIQETILNADARITRATNEINQIHQQYPGLLANSPGVLQAIKKNFKARGLSFAPEHKRIAGIHERCVREIAEARAEKAAAERELQQARIAVPQPILDPDHDAEDLAYEALGQLGIYTTADCRNYLYQLNQPYADNPIVAMNQYLERRNLGTRGQLMAAGALPRPGERLTTGQIQARLMAAIRR